MSAFIPASGVSSISGTRLQRQSLTSPLRPPINGTKEHETKKHSTSKISMVSYPYTGSGYGACGVPYANSKVGQFYLKTETQDIVATASSINIFSTLTTLLKQSGLDYELKKGGPFTIFAPSDDAFNKLLEPHSFSLYSALLRPENVAQLTKILAYHVIKGEVYSNSLDPLGGKLTTGTLSNDQITLMSYNRHFSAGTASIVRPDIPCTNGVIHVIDSVLSPSSYTTPEIMPKPSFLPDSLVTDYYGKMLTPRQALGIDQAPSDTGLNLYK